MEMKATVDERMMYLDAKKLNSSQIAKRLNREGYRNAWGKPFRSASVYQRLIRLKKPGPVYELVTQEPAIEQKRDNLAELHEGIRSVLRLKLDPERKLQAITSLVG